MSQNQSMDRFFGGGLFDNGLFGGGFFIIILMFILLLGEDLIDWIACNEEILVWIIILMVLFGGFDFGGCC